MNKKGMIALIKRELGLDDSTIRSVGVGPLMTQIAVMRGMEGVTKCDADSGDTSQYAGDLARDLGRRRVKTQRSVSEKKG